MGILDFNMPDMDTPQGQGFLAAAMDLLKARKMPGQQGAFSNAIGSAGQQYLAGSREAQNDQLKRKLTQAQLDELKQKTATEAFGLKRLQDWQNMLSPQTPGSTSPSSMGDPQINTNQSMGGIPMFSSGVTASQPPAGGGILGGSAPAAAGGAPRGGFPYALPGVGEQQSRAIASLMQPADYMKMFAEKSGPQAEFAKTLIDAGIDPRSPQGQKLLAENLAKTNYIAPVNARPGSILRDPKTNQPIAYNPQVPEGAEPMFDAAGNVSSMRPIAGALDAVTALGKAKTTGTNQATPTIAYRQDGTSVFSTKATDVDRAGGNPPAGAGNVAPEASGQRLAALQQALAQNQQILADPKTNDADRGRVSQDIADIQREMGMMGRTNGQANGLTPLPMPGVLEGAKLGQDELSKKGATLLSDNAQTNTVINRLQNIKMLAPAAITGAETGRRDFLNGLLSLAGLKGAEDAKTASDLVDKNSAQIVSALRMGQGGAGTDALQTLLSAANPSRHMTKEAMMEAADQLIAAQKMIQAKAKMLQPHYMERDPVAYGNKELTFDQNADPRVWQLEAMKPDEQAKYVRTLSPEVARDMLEKRKKLKEIGAL